MAGDALFISWSTVVRGREAMAVDVFQKVLAYHGGLLQAGHLESVEPMLLAPHGGELSGFIVLRGERAKLDEIRATDEFQRMTILAAAVADDIRVIDAYAGEQITRQQERFESIIADELST